jgi:hypothetical protein
MAHQLPVAVVCRVLGVPRSTVYARRQAQVPARPGPATVISDHDKVGDRFAALQPVYDAVIDPFGHLDADVARGSRRATTEGRSIARATSWAR